MALRDLADCGQSYWMDNLSRSMIDGGELRQRVADEGLRGITSNPKLFKDAITGSSDYDDQTRQLLSGSRSGKDIYEALAIEDVRSACDILRPVYNESQGGDGFVSLEVSPHLAHDTEGTVEEATRLYSLVDRPNVLIKIPGTPEGVPAIEETLYNGLNINITLLFAVESYEAVAHAYLRALQRRSGEGKSIDNVASVASFFLSRIDVLADRLLEHRNLPGGRAVNGVRAGNLMGKTAVANAKIAYQRFKGIYSSPPWRELEGRGARVQRLLWASTGTKNPSYPETMYIDPLIGRDTVSTMPEATAAAFDERGKLRPDAIEEGVDDAYRVFEDLTRIGIDINHVTWQLLHEGVQKFIEPFDALIEAIDQKRAAGDSSGGGR